MWTGRCTTWTALARSGTFRGCCGWRNCIASSGFKAPARSRRRNGWSCCARFRRAARSVQLYYGGAHGGDVDLKSELDILCRALDPNRLFIWAEAGSAEQADAVVAYARKTACDNRISSRQTNYPVTDTVVYADYDQSSNSF